MIIIVGYNIGVITSSFLFCSEVKGKKKKKDERNVCSVCQSSMQLSNILHNAKQSPFMCMFT